MSGRTPPEGSKGKARDRLGLVIENITPEIQKGLNLQEGSGVVVTDIEPGSSAALSKIQRMDVIKEVRGVRVRNVREYLGAIGEVKKGGTVLMLVIRNSRPLYIAVDIE
jgi:S1-C subfamily serine protease